MQRLSRCIALTVATVGLVLFVVLAYAHAPLTALAAFPVLVATGAFAVWWSARSTEEEVSLAMTCLSDPNPKARPPGVTGALGRAVMALRERMEKAVSTEHEALRAAQRAGEEDADFLRLLSHELRTPLNTILGFAQVLLDGGDGPLTDDQRRDVQTIHSSGEHLRELADEVIDLATLHVDQSRLQKEDFLVAPVLAEVARMMEGQARTKGLHLSSHAPAGLLIHADPKRLRQILVNLMSNAIKFTEFGEVNVVASVVENAVRLQVTDTGTGISKNDQNLLFHPFVQVGASGPRSARVRGSGLGLAICRRLVELHGGRIGVQSTAGLGSTFYAEFPCAGSHE